MSANLDALPCFSVLPVTACMLPPLRHECCWHVGLWWRCAWCSCCSQCHYLQSFFLFHEPEGTQTCEDAPTAKPKQHARVCEGASMTIDTACSSSLACTFVISKLAVSRSPTVSATTVQASSVLQAGPVRNQSEVCTHVSKLHLRFKDYEPMPASIVNGPLLSSAAFRQAGNLQQAARLQRLEPHAVSWTLCRVLRSRYAES